MIKEICKFAKENLHAMERLTIEIRDERATSVVVGFETVSNRTNLPMRYRLDTCFSIEATELAEFDLTHKLVERINFAREQANKL